LARDGLGLSRSFFWGGKELKSRGVPASLRKEEKKRNSPNGKKKNRGVILEELKISRKVEGKKVPERRGRFWGTLSEEGGVMVLGGKKKG